MNINQKIEEIFARNIDEDKVSWFQMQDDIRKLMHEYGVELIGKDEGEGPHDLSMGPVRNEYRKRLRQKNDQLKNNL